MSMVEQLTIPEYYQILYWQIYPDGKAKDQNATSDSEPIFGKNGARYFKHGAFCLETQNFPDAVNHVRSLIASQSIKVYKHIHLRSLLSGKFPKSHSQAWRSVFSCNSIQVPSGSLNMVTKPKLPFNTNTYLNTCIFLILSKIKSSNRF